MPSSVSRRPLGSNLEMRRALNLRRHTAEDRGFGILLRALLLSPGRVRLPPHGSAQHSTTEKTDPGELRTLLDGGHQAIRPGMGGCRKRRQLIHLSYSNARNGISSRAVWSSPGRRGDVHGDRGGNQAHRYRHAAAGNLLNVKVWDD